MLSIPWKRSLTEGWDFCRASCGIPDEDNRTSSCSRTLRCISAPVVSSLLGRRTSSGGSNSECDRALLLLWLLRFCASLSTTFSCSGSVTTAFFSFRGLKGNCILVAFCRRDDVQSRLRTCAFSPVGQEASFKPDCFPTLFDCSPLLKACGPSGDWSRRNSARSFPGVQALFLGVAGGSSVTTLAGRASLEALPRKNGCVGPAGFDGAFF